MQVQVQVAVTDILWAGPTGVIFSGRTGEGGRLIVRLRERFYLTQGEVYEVEGKESDYLDDRGRKHRQVTADAAARVRTSGALVGPWLQTLPGIGAERAARLVERFGSGILNILPDPSRSAEVANLLVPGRPYLGEKLAALVRARLIAMRAAETVAVLEAEFYARLEQYGVSDRSAARSLHRLLGTLDAWDKLLRHPYAVGAVLDWKAADHVGQRLLAARGDVADPLSHPDRLLGACDAVWRNVIAGGNTAALKATFLAALKRLGVPARAALEAGIRDRRVLVRGDLLRAPGAAWLERAVSSDLGRLGGARIPAEDWSSGVRDHEPAGHPLTDEQRCAVLGILGRPVALLQGSAGTGKTTTMRVLVDAWSTTGGHVVLAALAGKAALRLSRATGRRAFTLARLVYGLERREALAVEGRPAPDDLPSLGQRTLLVIDEGSMVDLATWRRILRLLPTGARFVVVGDVAQLPPVGLGQVFHDLVAEGRFVIRLTRVLRQAAGSPIIAAANAVREGIVPDLPAYSGPMPGVFILESPGDGPEAALEKVRNDMGAADAPRGEVLILAALNRTCRRFCSLMHLRREADGVQGRRLGPLAPFVAVGDPVIATRNRYDEALMNGLMGRVESLDPPTFRFDGEDAAREITEEAMAELMSAWAITVHRAQGSEVQRVVVALDGRNLLTREWLYTAITRATEQVVLVGSRDALRHAVGRLSMRRTAFPSELSDIETLGGQG